MANLRLRDRDAIITKQGLIFRVLGYSHPPSAFVCDAEYASRKIFTSMDPRSPRGQDQKTFFKFYEDEGYKLIQKTYPQYLIKHEMLGKPVVGVCQKDVFKVRKPERKLQQIIGKTRPDELTEAMKSSLAIVLKATGLRSSDFGVFGSMLHDFHNPRFSDIDLVIYGKEHLAKLRNVLQAFYESADSPFENEFETDRSIAGKKWRFRNLSPEEYLWHQRRKLIYALFKGSRTGRTIKTEFEPVKAWNEITNDYDAKTRIVPRGWSRILARVVDDDDSPFIPSIYGVEPLEIIGGPKQALEARRVVSYLEEFRLQAKEGETVEIAGNLEEVKEPRGRFYQMILTYCPRYYEQALKVDCCKS